MRNSLDNLHVWTTRKIGCCKSQLYFVSLSGFIAQRNSLKPQYFGIICKHNWVWIDKVISSGLFHSSLILFHVPIVVSNKWHVKRVVFLSYWPELISNSIIFIAAYKRPEKKMALANSERVVTDINWFIESFHHTWRMPGQLTNTVPHAIFTLFCLHFNKYFTLSTTFCVNKHPKGRKGSV